METIDYRPKHIADRLNADPSLTDAERDQLYEQEIADLRKLRASKTIGRNRKALIERIFSVATDGRSFNLDNGFRGVPVSIDWIRKEYEQFPFAKLTNQGDGKFDVHVHGNQWYEFRSIA